MLSIGIAAVAFRLFEDQLPLGVTLLLGLAAIQVIFSINSAYQFFAAGRHRGE